MSLIKLSRLFVATSFGIIYAIDNASAAVLLEETHLVASSSVLAQVAPQERSFDVVASGRYRVMLSDIGFPAPLTSADLVITRGVVSVARLAHTGTMDFDAAPGAYTVRVLGGGPSAGTLGVTVAPAAGGTALLDFSAGIAPNPNASPVNQSSLSTSFTPKSAGSYQVTLADRAFPVALASFDLMIVDGGGMPVARMCAPAIAGVCNANPLSFTASAARYDLFITSRAAAPENAGLISVQISGGPMSAVVYASTQPVGVLKKHADIEFPGAGSYAIGLSDLQFPAALTRVRAAIAQDSDLVANVTGTTNATFSANEGVAALYTVATVASSSGAGAFGVQITHGPQSVFNDVRAVTAPTLSALRAYVFGTSIAAGGQYRIQLKDFSFPSPVASLQMLVTQNGASLGRLGAAGSLDSQAGAAPVNLIVLTNTTSTALGLFGISIDAAPPSTTHVFDATQAVGDLFQTRTLSVGNSGSLDVSLNDLGFPIEFGDLALAVTRGTTPVGQIFGGGKFSFDAVPGDYALNFVARDAAAGYGLYGVKVEDSPPPPTITLTAAPTAVARGGTTSLTWTSIGATSCVASGGWSGTKPVTGSVTGVGPFSTDSTLTLACTGAGGSNSAAVNITVTNDSEKSGGGELDLWLLAAIVLVLLYRRSLFPRSVCP